MGGSAVAIGDPSQAMYYNPALLSFHDGDEEQARDGRAYTPTLVAQASTPIESAVKATNDNLDREIRDALDAFNAQMSPDNASLVATSSRDLRKVLEKVANRDLYLDGFVGISASQPADREGGAFYVGVRTVGVATSNISSQDVDLLDEYIDVMTQIAEGKSPLLVASQHPNLVDSNYQFSDPTTKLTSSADISALVIAEWGVALSKEFSIAGQAVAFGITPKLMRIDAYRDKVNFNNAGINSVDEGFNQFSDTKTSLTTLNADLGVATILAEHYRIGLAIKDVVGEDFRANQAGGQTLTVKLHPRTRLGAGYLSEKLSVGIDYDLQASTPMGDEQPSQELNMGAEFRPLAQLALRAGYRYDQGGVKGDVVSGGVGYRGQRIVADVAYAQGTDLKGASIQVGWTF